MKTHLEALTQRLAEAEATISALLSGQIDAVIDARSNTPILLSKAQSALRESEERYRQIVESTTDGILKIDAAANIVFTNQRFAEMLGYTATALLGRSIFSLMDDGAKTVAQDTMQKRRLGAKETVDLTFFHQDGHEIAVSMASAPILDHDGRYAGGVTLVRDVTEQKKMMAQLVTSDRMASVGTLAAGVAHEINNPLSVVIANLDYLIAAGLQNVSEPLKEAISDAHEAADRVRLIVRDLKIFSHPEVDERGSVDVERVMESSLRMAWNEIRHRARVVKRYESTPRVSANESRLGQVFLNLVVNAAQALPEGRVKENEIRVSTRRVAGRVLIDIGDNGAGIPPAIIGRIFDVFFTTKAVGVGTGLGLAISHRIITGLGGELTVTSEVGKGTTFTVSLPLASEQDVVVEASRSAPSPRAAPLRGRVLVIDDEALILRSITRILSPEHEVVTALGSQEALALCTAGETFDVIFCDLMMPDMAGMDFHRELTHLAPEQAARMVFVTGGAFTPDALQFLGHADREFIDKPFDAGNLRAVVQRRLAAMSAHPPSTTAQVR